MFSERNMARFANARETMAEIFFVTGEQVVDWSAAAKIRVGILRNESRVGVVATSRIGVNA